jgi:pSer/pThr/pTyr-binding forkhead associated (FHA) protein
MKLSLEVMTDGKQKGKLLPIGLPQFLIGRDPQCQLRPASPSISKRHCAVIQREGRAFVRDFDSTNGTFVNDRQIKGEIELQHGDVLRIGPIMFTVHLEVGAPVNKPTPPPPTKNVSQAGAKPTPAPRPADQTPKPPTKETAEAAAKKTAPISAAGAKEPSEDDDIAAMLLSMGDDSTSGLSPDMIPEGSTVMDLTVPPGGAGAEDAAKKEREKEKPKASGNTQSAAKEILEKYMKRPRPV